MPYFRRAGHVGLLIAASFFYALPGLVYWLSRRKHLICPRCGLDWEHSSRALAVVGPDTERRLIEEEPDAPLPSAGLKRRVLGVTMVLLATFLVLIGFVEAELAAAAVGSVVGAGGSLTFYWGWQGLQERRKALMQGLQRKILKLASMKGGTLTVTQVAADLNLAIPAAEKILNELDDGFRVRSEISAEGVIYYEFPELLHRKELGPG
jgi:hypothetical protein